MLVPFHGYEVIRISYFNYFLKVHNTEMYCVLCQMFMSKINSCFHLGYCFFFMAHSLGKNKSLNTLVLNPCIHQRDVFLGRLILLNGLQEVIKNDLKGIWHHVCDWSKSRERIRSLHKSSCSCCCTLLRLFMYPQLRRD